MSSFYFINDRNESEGGFTIEQLQSMGIKPNTLVWCEGLENWQKAADVELLKPLFAKMPPPVPQLPPPVIKISVPPLIEPKIVPVVQKAAPVVQRVEPQKKGWFGRLNWLQKIGFFFLVFVGLYAVVATIAVLSNGNTSSYKYNGGTTIEGSNSGWTAAQNSVRENPAYYVAIDKKYNANELLGGISDGFIAVSNNSDFAFDRVVMRVYYIKSDGGVHSSTTVVARNIQGRSTVNEPFPNSGRGTSVRVKIQFIDCAALDIHQEYIVE